jgi:hypothetical protein
MIDNILNKESSKLTFKERQLIIDYFRHLVNKEFEDFKTNYLKKDKTEIFEKAYLIDTYDNIRIRLLNLSYFTIAKLLKYKKDRFIDYMYNADVNDCVFDYYDNIEHEIVKEVSKLKQQNEIKVA